MTKQEEIFYILQDVRLGELSEYEATLKLQELGVVIKVDEPHGCHEDNDTGKKYVKLNGMWVHYVPEIVAVEPLIVE